MANSSESRPPEHSFSTRPDGRPPARRKSAGAPAGEPVHPGKILRDEFLVPQRSSIGDLAATLRVSLRVVSELIDGKRSIDGEMALRLSIWSGKPAEFWMDLQQRYDLEIARKQLGRELDEIRPRRWPV